MKANAFALTGLLMLIPASTLAQQTTTSQPSMPESIRLAHSNHDYMVAASVVPSVLEWDANRQYVNDRARQVLDNTSPARLDRAERVAVLLNGGDCTGAQALAVQENDRRLARRIGAICQAKN